MLNLENVSKKKFLLITIISEIIYLTLLVVGPTIVVCTKYKIFQKVQESETIKLTGVGLVLIVILGIYLYSKIVRFFRKLPETKLYQQRIKFTAQMIFGLIPYGLVYIAVMFAQDNINLAIETLLTCLIFMMASVVFDGLCLKYVDAEAKIREEAARQNAIDSRKDKV
jgi:hypothetical protein